MLDVSVIVPNYNHAAYLPQALDHIFSQSPKEVIVVDDASTDESSQLLKSYKKKYPQLTIFYNAQNFGPIPTINFGLSQASSEYVAFCAADDIILPGFLEETSAFLDEHQTLGLCCGKICHFSDQDPKAFIPSPMPLGDQPCVFSPEDLIKTFKKTIFFINTNAALYRKKYLLEYGGYNEKLLHISDWYLSCQVALHYGAGFIPKTFGAFRLSSNSYSANLKHSHEKNHVYRSLIQEIKKEGNVWNHIFVKTGLLAHAGISMILFLFLQPRYWAYFPKAFVKKCQFHWHKMIRSSTFPKRKKKKIHQAS